jgi:transcriptional regulator with XRE-family HTH domain
MYANANTFLNKSLFFIFIIVSICYHVVISCKQSRRRTKLDFTEYLKHLREERGLSIRGLAMRSGVSAGYLSQVEKGDRGTPSPEILKKLYNPLRVQYEDLMRVAGYIDNPRSEENSYDLTDKEERDIQKDLQKIIDNLESSEGYAAFDGQAIEDMDEEDKELLIASLENSLRLAKRMAKEKFTPNKYKK